MTFCHPSVPFSSALLPVIPLPVRFIRGVIITGERRQNAGERSVPHKVEQDAVQILLNEEQSFLTLLQADFRTSKALSLFSFPFSLALLFFISLLYLSHISPSLSFHFSLSTILHIFLSILFCLPLALTFQSSYIHSDRSCSYTPCIVLHNDLSDV